MSLNMQEKLGRVESFRDVVVVPYDVILQRTSSSPLEHKGGPILPDWDSQVAARFCRDGKPIDTLPDQPPIVSQRIDEPAVWCDPCYHHFGHQIVDFGTRILQGVTEFPQARFLFAATADAGIRSLEDTPAFFRAMLDWYGVPAEQVTLISEPTRVAELHVPPQAEQWIGNGPSAAYLDLLDAVVERHFGKVEKSGTLYVSRAGQPYCMAGESYLEELFAGVGVSVLRPESLPLKEQLRHYYLADRLIFSEGAALNALWLMGRSVGDLTFIQRRPKLFGFPRESFQRRARSVEYINVLAGLVHGMRFNGRERLHQAISIPNEAALLDYLGSVDQRMVERWDRQRYREARDSDVRRWIEVESNNPASQAPNSTQTVIQRMQELGLEHLVPFAKEHLPDGEGA
nr:glycosyltransferase 61 family protein [Thiothrix nivea]